ncbi:type VI secretion system protein TssA [Massilia rhizosphaerae]|uniref:type VI secretion system protein TssA n=1 Tax=Massilia rhizosphaerae TaxID=2784389 RepID=UPI0018DB2A8B|nr:type VI secretion system protein TssA [Massilia rhizosphaerae]
MLNLERLLAPVSADKPCGDDLAFSSEIDAIVRARQADDPSLEQGAWVTELKEADWKFVARECAQLIEKRSKDLQLAVWLAEATVRTAGLREFGDSLLLTAMLCERYWDGLYPLPDEDGVERRIGNLSWLAARIAPWLRDVPLTEGAGGHALRDFDVARAQGADALAKLEGARQRTPQAFYTNLMHDCEHCAAAIDRLERSVDAVAGADGPSFSAARSALESLVLFIKPALKEAAPPAAAADGAVAAPAQAAASAGPLQSRAQALAQLRAVADYFRRTEPHSPVAYLADKAAQWGEQPLHVWLRAVVKDDAAFAHIEEMLGVGPRPS